MASVLIDVTQLKNFSTMMKRSLGLPLLLSGLLIGSASCRQPTDVSVTPSPSTPSTETATTDSVDSAESPEDESTASTAEETPNYFQQAIDRATSAVNLSQSAFSQDDWRLVVNRWQQAITFLEAVPASDPSYSQAQAKITEYQTNLDYARQQASQPPPPPQDGVVVVTPQNDAPEPVDPTSRSSSQPSIAASNTGTFRAPIISRAGGTPVVNVNFNGGQNFPMIVDTGASGTVITPAMAAALGVEPVGQTQVSTASARNVTFDLGYVQSMEVGGAVARNVLVAVSSPSLELGLLGHDFFGDYDVTIRQDHVEFSVR